MESGVKLNNHDNISILATGEPQIWLKAFCATSLGKENIINYIVHSI